MKISFDAKPKKIDDAFTINSINQDGSLSIVPRKHPELKVIKMNRVSRFVYENCSNSNTVENIINKVLNSFEGADYETVKKDLFNIIYAYWRIGFVEFENNPYSYFFTKAYGKYTFKLMSEDEAAKTFKTLDQTGRLDYDCKFEKNFSRSESRIRQSVFHNVEHYFSLEENGEIKVLFCLKTENEKQTSMGFVLLYVDEAIDDLSDSILNLINWGKDRCASLLSKDFYRINAFVFEAGGQYAAVMNGLGFKEIGNYRDCIIVDGKPNSIKIKSLRI